MKILIFSDTHLTLPFEEKKFNFLKDIIKRADQVIINGDFWEGYLISFDQFIESPWKHLFPILKQKNTVYTFGNHDQEYLLDTRRELFSTIQTRTYTLPTKDHELIIEHGNRLLPFGKEGSQYHKQHYYVTSILHGLDAILFKKLGRNYAKPLLKFNNNLIKQKLKKTLKENQLYVCGHTHLAEVDYDNQFINTGMIKNGLGQYIIVENNTITPHEEWYE